MKTKTILLIILGLAILAVLAFFALKPKAPQERVNPGENITETEKAQIVETSKSITTEISAEKSFTNVQNFLNQ